MYLHVIYCVSIALSHVTHSGASVVPLQSSDEVSDKLRTNSPIDVDDRADVNSLCPSQREEAAARGRSCLRKCRTDADCISNRKRCLCDGLCGWSCVRPDLNCEELPPLVNGSFQVSGDYFGARVVYTCDESYFMSGSRERFCQGDATWSNTPPICKEKAMCGPVMSVPHARENVQSSQKEFDINTIVQYECFVGYEARGSPIAQCLYLNDTAQWSGPHLKCIPITCGDPGLVMNAVREVTSFTFTSKVTYTCSPAFEVVGDATRFCQSSGQWSGSEPSCERVRCPPPQVISHGRIVTSQGNTEFGAVVEYECDYGHKMEGNSSVECRQDKEWSSPAPRCLPVDCGHPGHLANGQLIGDDVTTFNSVIGFKCNRGMTLISQYNSTTCLITGLWSHPLPQCVAPCSLNPVENGRVTSHPPESVVPHGQTIVVDCKPQYELQSSENTTPITCNNGTWSRSLVCVPERCKQLPERPKDGLVIAPRTDHGMRALYQCRDGFILVGSNVTTCNFGKWSSPVPVCQEFYCPFPGLLENGLVLLVGHMGMYEYRDYVKKISHKKQIVYQCNKGYYVAGASGATCVDGQWSPPNLPKCLLGSYPTLDWLQRRRRRSSHPTRRYKHINDTVAVHSDRRNGEINSTESPPEEEQFLNDVQENDRYLMMRLRSLDQRIHSRDRSANTSFIHN